MTQPDVQMDPEDLVIMRALTKHMRKILEAFRQFGRVAPTWAATDISQINVERDLLERQFGPAGIWAADTAAYAADASLLFLLAQSDHLNVLHRMYDTSTGLMVGIGPPARSLLEISGYLHWLIHPDTETVRTRASRALLSQLNDATRKRSAAKDLGAPNKFVSDAGQVVRAIKDRISRDFYPSEIAHNKHGDLILRGETHPGPGEALRHLSHAGSDYWNSKGAYSFLSNASHPTLHVIGDTIQYDDQGTPVHFGHADTTYHYRLARMVMAGFLSTWQLNAVYRGLEQQTSRDLLREIDDLPKPPR